MAMQSDPIKAQLFKMYDENHPLLPIIAQFPNSIQRALLCMIRHAQQEKKVIIMDVTFEIPAGADPSNCKDRIIRDLEIKMG